MLKKDGKRVTEARLEETTEDGKDDGVETSVVVGQAAGGLLGQALQMIAMYVTLAAMAGTELSQGGADITTVTTGGTTT